MSYKSAVEITFSSKSAGCWEIYLMNASYSVLYEIISVNLTDSIIIIIIIFVTIIQVLK